jgi:hypothetical protein
VADLKVQQLADNGLLAVGFNFGLSMAIQRMLPNNGERWLVQPPIRMGGA